MAITPVKFTLEKKKKKKYNSKTMEGKKGIIVVGTEPSISQRNRAISIELQIGKRIYNEILILHGTVIGYGNKNKQFINDINTNEPIAGVFVNKITNKDPVEQAFWGIDDVA